MKRSKLFNVLAFGLFLSMTSIAFVNTAEAYGTYNIPGPNNVTPIDDLYGLTFLNIHAPDPGWHPGTIVVQVCSNDGQSLSGIEAWYDYKHRFLSGSCYKLYNTYSLDITVLLENGTPERDVTIEWWFEQ